jgi:uncharacterized protein (TIGR02001 family)
MAVSRSVAALCGAAGVALLSLSGAAQAEDKFTWSASLTGTSDYVFRGISQTDNDPTIQGSIGVGYGMFYAGWWASGLDWDNAFLGDPNAQVEMDWYGGIKPTWGPATFDFGVIYYTYPSSTKNPIFGDTSILELKAGVSGEILPKLTAGVTYYYAPNVNDFEYGVVEGTLAYALPKVWVFDPTVSALYGYQDGMGDRVSLDYSYWNAGLALAVDHLTFDFRYWDTDIGTSSCGGIDVCDERFVFSATVAMP